MGLARRRAGVGTTSGLYELHGALCTSSIGTCKPPNATPSLTGSWMIPSCGQGTRGRETRGGGGMVLEQWAGFPVPFDKRRQDSGRAVQQACLGRLEFAPDAECAFRAFDVSGIHLNEKLGLGTHTTPAMHKLSRRSNRRSSLCFPVRCRLSRLYGSLRDGVDEGFKVYFYF